ncbi:hypothetical protein [Pseudonocardia sp. ICBG1293]|uniref:hypothetical protein n=1 Tax=Pseudonocardia sp. ICBG1293 TaxID=2844382 RepID=UPI001CCB483E|nr:hypothetical protein [Pseudonocardia sp. ICBG1293]
MNAPLRAAARTIGSAIADRAVEIAVGAALTGATVVVTWWFAGLLGLAVGWWAAAEVRLWRARRAVPASSPRAELGTVDAVSPPAEVAAGPVSAGQQVEARAEA